MKRIIALGSTIAAAGALLWLGVAASASPAARSAVSGTEHFQVVGTSATSNTPGVIATGVFTAGGVDHTGAQVDTLVFPNGSFKVAHKGTTTHTFNPKTCLLADGGKSTLTLYGGTGAYAGISGSGTSELNVLAIAARSGGKCSMTKPVAFQAILKGTAMVHL